MSDFMYITIFVFAGFAWTALVMFVLGVFAGVSRIRTPKPQVEAKSRWQREWEAVEKEISR
jgi:hypothetical protein